MTTSPLEFGFVTKEKFYFNPKPEIGPIIPATPFSGRFILRQRKQDYVALL